MTTEKGECRTNDQFLRIVLSITNGNLPEAARLCVEHGFYASNLKVKYEELKPSSSIWNYALVIEMAQEMRYNIGGKDIPF